jgi:uncharacterized membrane protein required for colicin V production
MELLPADYVLAALVMVLSVTGLFRGFSGTLAFVLAAAAAGAAGTLVWSWSGAFLDEAWMRYAVVLVSSLLAFGIVRVVVKKLVDGLLAQPGDAIFGFLAGLALGAGAVLLWAHSGMFVEYSNIVGAVRQFLG